MLFLHKQGWGVVNNERDAMPLMDMDLVAKCGDGGKLPHMLLHGPTLALAPRSLDAVQVLWRREIWLLDAHNRREGSDGTSFVMAETVKKAETAYQEKMRRR